MPLSNASRLADFGTGIGTAGAIIQVDNANQRLGVGTTAPTATLGVAGIVSATAFYGDGSNLDGVASAGLGTALSDEEFNPLTVIYQTSDTLSVGTTITVDPPDATTKVAYTQYADIQLEDDADLIVADGDDFIPDILGLSTEGFSFSNTNGNGVFGTVYADNIENAAGRGGPNFPLGITVAGVSTFSGNVSIGGTLTYEDVTNVDSVGVVTARSGIDITGASAGINGSSNLILKAGGSEKVRVTSTGQLMVGSTSGGGKLRVFGDSGRIIIGDSSHNYYDGDNHLFRNYASQEKLRIGSVGQIGLSGPNYGSSGQVLTSQGASAAPQWASVSSTPVRDSWYQNADSDNNPWGTSAIWGQTGTTNTKMARKSGFPTVAGQQVNFDTSNGYWTFPSTGTWAINFQLMGYGFSPGFWRVAFDESTDSGSSFSYANSGGQMWHYQDFQTNNITMQFRTTVVISNATTYRMKVLLAGPANSNTKVRGDATQILYEKLV